MILTVCACLDLLAINVPLRSVPAAAEQQITPALRHSDPLPSRLAVCHVRGSVLARFTPTDWLTAGRAKLISLIY